MRRSALFLFFFSISAFGMHSGEDDAQSVSHQCGDEELVLLDDDAFGKCWRNCSSYFGLDTDCVLEVYPHFSASCLTCMAEMTSCGLKHCKRKCSPWPLGHGSSSEQCKACSREHCGEEFDACTGKAASHKDS